VPNRLVTCCTAFLIRIPIPGSLLIDPRMTEPKQVNWSTHSTVSDWTPTDYGQSSKLPMD